MTRKHTIETVRDAIAELRDKDTVYKVEVDLLKSHFNSAFEGDWKAVKDTKYLSIPHDDRSEIDGKLYFEAPYSVAHWYGKKFSKFLEGMTTTEFKDATVSHRNRWRPLWLALEELKARQVKGRRPAETKKVIGTRTQLRATCPCCFNDQAVRGERLVAHGYTLDYDFQNGTCIGAGEMHFGTLEGKAFTMNLAADAMGHARDIEARATRFEKGEEHVTIRKQDYRGEWTTISNPTDRQKADFIAGMRREAEGYRRYAGMLNEAVMKWEAAEPREVEVEITE